MRKESFFSLLLRWIAVMGVLFFMGMLYWSSLVQEDTLRDIKLKLDKMTYAPAAVVTPVKKEARTIESKWPNLLTEDLFYTEVLPNKLLPKDFVAHGTRRSAVLGKPDSLHPFVMLFPFTDLIAQCQLTLAKDHVGKNETMAPYLATRIEERGEAGSEFWIYLRDDAYWQPLDPSFFPEGFELAPQFLQKHQVTAHDVKFYYDAVMNPFVQEGGAIAIRSYMADIAEVRVIDDFTLVVRWKKVDNQVQYAARSITGHLQALPRFVYQYFPDGQKIVEDDEAVDTYLTHSVWGEQFSSHWAKNIIVSCGPWIFDGMSDTQLNFRRNPDHFNPYEVLVEVMQVQFKETMEAIWQDFKVGHTDMCILNSDKKLELQDFLASKEYEEQVRNGLTINDLEYVRRAFFYVGWNEATPFFANKKVRQAMTMAIDRNRMIAQNINGMGVPITGTFSVDSPSYDHSIIPWPYDPAEAIRFLEEEGWIDHDGDGIRDKEIDGQYIPFRFTLTYYIKNPSTRIDCESIRTFLKEIGVDCQPNGIDITDLSTSLGDKDFDAIYFGWGGGVPPDDPRQIWHSSGALEKGSSNSVGFANIEADKLMESLVYEANMKKRIELYHAFDAIIHEQQPYTFLYAPKVRLLYRSYVKDLFIPRDRQDLIPGADVGQPDLNLIWLDP